MGRLRLLRVLDTTVRAMSRLWHSTDPTARQSSQPRDVGVAAIKSRAIDLKRRRWVKCVVGSRSSVPSRYACQALAIGMQQEYRALRRSTAAKKRQLRREDTRRARACL